MLTKRWGDAYVSDVYEPRQQRIIKYEKEYVYESVFDEFEEEVDFLSSEYLSTDAGMQTMDRR